IIPDTLHGYIIGTPDSGGLESLVDVDKLGPDVLAIAGAWQQPTTVQHRGQPVLFGAAVFRMPMKVLPTAKPGVHRLKLTLTFGVCNDDTCFPPKDIALPIGLHVLEAAAGAGTHDAAAGTAGPAPVIWNPGADDPELQNKAVWSLAVHGSTLMVGVTLPEGYHTYKYSALPMGDMNAAMETRIVVESSEGVKLGSGPVVENHKMFDEYGEMVVGPEGDYRLPLAIPAGLAPGEHTLNVTIQFNECNHEGCFNPLTKTIAVPFVVGASAPVVSEPTAKLEWVPGSEGVTAQWKVWLDRKTVHRGETVNLVASIEMAPTNHSYLPSTGASDATGTKITPDWASVKGLTAGGPLKAAGDIHDDPTVGPVLGPQGTFTLPIKVAADAPFGEQKLKFEISFVECEEGSCYPPEMTTLEIAFAIEELPGGTPITDTPPAGAGTTTTGTTGTGGGTDPNAPATDEQPLDMNALIPFLGMAFLGGIILNLMPCVLPVLGIKVLGFVESAHDSETSPVVHSLAFTFGVMLSFWVLAGIMVSAQAAGKAAGWGFQMGNPVFVFVLITFMILFAMNLFGVFEVGTSLQSLAGGRKKKKSGLSGSVVTGITATLVATPCTAPFMGSALGFTSTQPPIVTVLVLTMIGLGMSAPYIVLSASPALLKRIPKPGPWMVSLKQAMGFMMLAFVPWLLWVYVKLVGRDVMLWSMVAIIVVCAGGWVYGRWATPLQTARTRYAALAMAMVMVLGSTVWGAFQSNVEPPATSGGVETHTRAPNELPWEPYNVEKLAQLRAAGTPVLVDYTADWCLTCKSNARSALNVPETLEYVRAHGIVPMEADYTRTPDDLTADLKKHGRRGVPLVLYYPPNGAEPIQLPNVMLTPSAALDPIREADAKAGVTGALPQDADATR
ncbi:MAG: protein-disulfide reductase DsbD domain-containing protein, partial [Planctomycetota bacterium]